MHIKLYDAMSASVIIAVSSYSKKALLWLFEIEELVTDIVFEGEYGQWSDSIQWSSLNWRRYFQYIQSVLNIEVLLEFVTSIRINIVEIIIYPIKLMYKGYNA